MASLANEDVSFAKIADLIEKDTVLAGNILKLVNSALYGFAGTVNSIRHAVSLLGITKLRNAALSMSVSRMWGQVKTPAGWSTANFNQHSVGVGILADLLAQRLNVEYAEGAFAAGLFHDLGLLLVAIGMHDEYKQLSLLTQQSKQWDPEYEIQVLGMTHAELSAEALAQWNLPEEIQTAVRYHGSPELDPTKVRRPARVEPRLERRGSLCKGHGSVCEPFRKSQRRSAGGSGSTRDLGERLPAILSEFENEFTAIKAYF